MREMRRLLEIDSIELRRSDKRDKLREETLKTYFTHPGSM